MEDYNSGQFQSVDDVIKSLCSREGDIAGLNKLRYKEVAKDVFAELNLSTIKQTKRVLVTIDPHLGSINVPDDYFEFSTLSGINRGRIDPLVYNPELQDDMVDLGLDMKCESECGCTDSICNSSKHYETITEDVSALMPDATYQTFTKIIRKFINKDGSVYMSVTEPVAIYDNGAHTSTELKTTDTLLCKLEVKPECGCVIDNKWNRDLWGSFASNMVTGYEGDMLCEFGVPDQRYFPEQKTYNISNDGKRIVFPSNFAYRKIMLRYYAFQPTKKILIPYIAKEAFMDTTKRFTTKYDKKETLTTKQYWENEMNKSIGNLRLKTSKLMLNEFYEYLLGRNATRDLYWNNNISHIGYYYPY